MKARNICGTSGCSPDSVTSPEALDKSEITDDTALNKDGLQERVLSDKVDESSTAETEIQIVPETVLDEMDHNLGSPCNIVVPETISVDVEISETSPFFPLNNITDDSNHEVKTIKNVVSNLVFKPPSKPVRKRSNIKTSEAVIIPEKNTSNNRENSTEFFEIFASGRSKTDATYCETNDCNSKSLTTNSGMKKNETKNRCKRNTPTSSNCTISFEPLPPNYRKPKYKQMTLTQNIFFEFHDEGENGSSDPTTKPQRENDDHSNNPSKECNKERINEDVSNTSDRRGLQHNGNIDNLDYSGDDDSNLDCTYVPPHLIANSSVNTPGDDVSMSKINEKVDFRMRDAGKKYVIVENNNTII